jgi:hypothetical protein
MMCVFDNLFPKRQPTQVVERKWERHTQEQENLPNIFLEKRHHFNNVKRFEQNLWNLTKKLTEQDLWNVWKLIIEDIF